MQLDPTTAAHAGTRFTPATGGGAPLAAPSSLAPRTGASAAFVTGAYLPSGDPEIDRMLQLERALKLNARGF